MRILIVTNTYPPADITGVGALVYDLARRLDSEGHFVRVLTRSAPQEDSLASPTGGRKLLFPWHVARLYLQQSRQHEFDLVHVHESDGVLVCLALRLARWLNRPAGRARLVATLQVSYRRERWSVRSLYDRSQSSERSAVRGKRLSRPTFSEQIFAWTRAPLLSLLGRLTARLSDAVIAPSEVTAQELRQDYGAHVDGVIANGVQELPVVKLDVEPDDAKAIGLTSESLQILYAGRLRTRKAVAVLIEAFARVRQKHVNARLVVAGDGEQRDALEQQASELDMGENAVHFLGAIPRPEMVRWYRRADIFCLPSIYEGFPLAILEAMAAGLPIVTTTASGMPEAVDEGVSGWLVPTEDVTALSDALCRLLADERLRESMGKASLQRVQNHFAIDKICADYMDLWQGLLKQDASEQD